MAKKQTVEKIIELAQVREDREWARRLAKLKQGFAQADFTAAELSALEDVVFRAFGRTKLG
jgi:hypothetical protein